MNIVDGGMVFIMNLSNHHLVWALKQYCPLHTYQFCKIYRVVIKRPDVGWAKLYITELTSMGFKFSGEDKLHIWEEIGGGS